MTLQHLDPWTLPHHNSTVHAQIWHARRHARWLLTAGAEPRFSLLMISGKRAQKHWSQILQEQGITLQTCTTQVDRPLPKVLVDHRGDHFNRTLFVLEGLDQVCSENPNEGVEILQTLNGQRSQIKQMATWVCIVIQNPWTLSLLRSYAPALYRILQKRCLIWDSHEARLCQQAEDLPALDLEQTLSSPHCIENVFRHLSTFDTAIDSWSMSRIIRCGYAEVPATAIKEWQIYYDLWSGHIEGQRQMGGLSMTRNLPDGLHCKHALVALLHRNHALPKMAKQLLKDRLTDHEHYLLNDEEYIRSWDHLSTDLKHCVSLRKSLIQRSTISAEELAFHQSQWPSFHIELKASYALDLAQAYAMQEDIDSCLATFEALSTDSSVMWEARFIAHEYLVKIYTDLHQRTKAQACLDQLWNILDILHSPLYEVRALQAKADFLGVLDQSRSHLERQEAQRLAHIHGIELS